tara:strand:- start:205 stop:522 length:318 start_codon:yes stop_codon:yes gene_type:complete
LIPDPILLKAMLIAAKITIIFQAVLLFYFFGKDGKIPFSSRNIFFVIGNSGCLFLAGGIILENLFLIKIGIFILIVHALIDAYFIISKYLRIKSFKEKGEGDVKK